MLQVLYESTVLIPVNLITTKKIQKNLFAQKEYLERLGLTEYGNFIQIKRKTEMKNQLLVVNSLLNQNRDFSLCFDIEAAEVNEITEMGDSLMI